ncbi:hypothetical protein L1987_88356 [Smallanthus sonchifolius]|nr:hypothetical protein L1987_88356 [Smallanthus sonchifolius]
MSGRGFLPCYQKGGWVKQTPSLDEHGLSQVEPGCAAGCSDRKEISGAMPILHGSGESLIKERAATRLNDLVGSTDVVAGEPLLLLPRRFTQNRAWMELNKIWRTNRKLAYSLWGINAPGRIELTYGTWLSPAHISLAALNRPVCLPLWRPPYLTPATLSLQATPAEQDALRFPLLWTHL